MSGHGRLSRTARRCMPFICYYIHTWSHFELFLLSISRTENLNKTPSSYYDPFQIKTNLLFRLSKLLLLRLTHYEALVSSLRSTLAVHYIRNKVITHHLQFYKSMLCPWSKQNICRAWWSFAELFGALWSFYPR